MFQEMLENVRGKCPLIHNITNYVTVNDCANIVLACGASPIMSDDQSEVRAALAHATGADDYMPDRAETAAKKRRIEEADPHSTMVYRYEHAADLDEKMEILSQGLTSIMGEFTLEDVEEVAGARAEKMLSAMLDRGFVYETRPGFYKA